MKLVVTRKSVTHGGTVYSVGETIPDGTDRMLKVFGDRLERAEVTEAKSGGKKPAMPKG